MLIVIGLALGIYLVGATAYILISDNLDKEK